MKIDLHCHCSEYSPCATRTATEQIEDAVASGLDGLAFTNHFTLIPEELLAELNNKYAPFKIYNGLEVDVNVDGELEEFVVLGVTNENLSIQGFPFDKLMEIVRKENGFIFLPHPMRRHAVNERVLSEIDGIEIDSVNTPRQFILQFIDWSKQFNLITFNNSDAHHQGQIGHNWNNFKKLPDTTKELVEMLNANR